MKPLSISEIDLWNDQLVCFHLNSFFGPQHLQILKHEVDDLVHMLQTLLGQVQVDDEEAEALRPSLLTSHQRVGPAKGFKL